MSANAVSIRAMLSSGAMDLHIMSGLQLTQMVSYLEF
jgi:hypothetical protein